MMEQYIVLMDEGNTWQALSYPEKIKQIFTDEEYLCVLDVAGRLHCDELPDPYAMGMSGAAYFMSEQALAINEEQEFLLVNGHVLDGVIALLPDGSLLYPALDEHKTISIDKEVAMLSGDYLLTKSGNVYKMLVNDITGTTSKGEVVFRHYDEAKTTAPEDSFDAWKDIIGIEAYFNSVYGVDKEGKVLVINFD